MENTSFADFLVSPTVLVAVFIGGSALLLYYILNLFRIEHDTEERNQSEQVSSGPERKKEAKQPKKKNWNRPSEKQNFSSPWLLKTLKNHTGQVLNMDYSSTGKYIASCAEEEPDPDMNSSSGSECNKENSRPPSTPEPSPKGGLTRRQRKNRRREDSSPDSKKKVKSPDKKTDPLPQYVKLSIPENVFAGLLHPHLLTYEQMYAMGYPVQNNNAVVFFNRNYERPKSKWNLNAPLFIPGRILTDYFTDNRSDSSETEDSSGSEPDLSVYKCPATWNSSDEGIERTCVRCQRGFFTTKTEYLTQERCVYHWGKLHVVHRGDSRKGTENVSQYTCCKGKADSVGCTTCKLHVWNGVVSGMNVICEGYVKTRQRKSVPADGNYGVYALDCEMCYTVAGLELTKVTVVAMDGKRVYDTFVKPLNEIIDYNTRFSGITPKDLKPSTTKTLKEVQNDLRGFISAETIIIGHGLENDLRALKLIHGTVVDTAWSFPHYSGLPYKRSLKSLVSTILRRQVQCDATGHDSYEDACACMELMLYKVRKENRGCKI